MDLREKVQILVNVMILVVLLGVIFNWSAKFTEGLIGWLVTILISVVLSGFCGSLIERASGDTLKKISLTIPIGNYGFSISLFVIATVILKAILF